MNSTTNYDILTSIDNMTDMIQESNTNVLESMLNASDKAFMIMENYYGNDYTNFAIFQESDEAHPFKEDGVLKTILMFIPNLLKWVANKISGLFDKKKKSDGLVANAVNKIKSLTDDQKSFLGKLTELIVDKDGEISGPIKVAGFTISAAAATAVTSKVTSILSSGKNAVSRLCDSVWKDVTDIDKNKLYIWPDETGGYYSSIDHSVLLAYAKKIDNVVKGITDILSKSEITDEDIKNLDKLRNDVVKSDVGKHPFLRKAKKYTVEDNESFQREFNVSVENTLGNIKSTISKTEEIAKKQEETIKAQKENKDATKPEGLKPETIKKAAEQTKASLTEVTKIMNNLLEYAIALDTQITYLPGTLEGISDDDIKPGNDEDSAEGAEGSTEGGNDAGVEANNDTPETPETPAPETPAPETPETSETPTPETPAPETPETPDFVNKEMPFSDIKNNKDLLSAAFAYNNDDQKWHLNNEFEYDGKKYKAEIAGKTDDGKNLYKFTPVETVSAESYVDDTASRIRSHWYN